MKKQLLRRLAALSLAIAVLWVTVLTTRDVQFPTQGENLVDLTTIYTALVRWELGDFFHTDLLSAFNVMALRQSPYLMQLRNPVTALMAQAFPDTSQTADSIPESTLPTDFPADKALYDGLLFTENGIPSQTVVPTGAQNYTVINGVYIKNTSSRQLIAEELSQACYNAQLTQDGPQVLIIHSHGTEAYTMPSEQEYDASGTYRTLDTNYNVVRIGDEIATILSTYGISVLHDRTLHDADNYNDAYESSYESIVRYLEKYPSISFVLDVHRDAIQDANGNQYKLVTREDPRIAQCCLVMGVAHDGWRDNLQLAIAVQERLNTLSPTLMRPITARDYRYNQHLSLGSILVEIGAAGNSLDEAILGARYFAKGFAETILSAE